MNITFTGLAIIASLSNNVVTPVTSTSITPLKTELFSKNELVQIINQERNMNVTLDEAVVSVPSISIETTVLAAKTYNNSKTDSISNKTEKAASDE